MLDLLVIIGCLFAIAAAILLSRGLLVRGRVEGSDDGPTTHATTLEGPGSEPD